MASDKPSSAMSWVAAGVVGAIGAASFSYTVDDAYVLARYARRIASGLGYTMNDGAPTDGVTGPLALVPALLGELAVGDPVLASKLTGLACVMLSAGLVVRSARLESAAHAAVALAFLAGSPFLGIWAVAGLETGPATLGLTIAGLAATRPDDPDLRTESGWGRSCTLGLSVAALAWLRPELAPACLVLLGAAPGRSVRERSLRWGLASLGAVAVVAFRVTLFGTPIPLSAHAKPADLGHGLEYVGRAVLLVFGGLGWLPVGLAAREGTPARRSLSLLLAVHLGAVLLAGGDWMPGFRLFVPVLPLYALVVTGPIVRRLRHPASRVRGAVMLLALVVPMVAGGVSLFDLRAAAASREASGAELATWIAGRGPVALVDVGYLGYRSGVEVIDLGGITDPEVAAFAGGHAAKRLDPGFLRSRAPRTILLHSARPPLVVNGELRGSWGHPVEQRIARMPWVRAQFRVARVVPYAPDYHYVVMVRRTPVRSGGSADRSP